MRDGKDDGRESVNRFEEGDLVYREDDPGRILRVVRSRCDTVVVVDASKGNGPDAPRPVVADAHWHYRKAE